jgi:hypothetical protein
MPDVNWQLQDAQQRFGDVIGRTDADGPQPGTRDFKEFLLSGPRLDLLDIRCDAAPARNVDLPPPS